MSEHLAVPNATYTMWETDASAAGGAVQEGLAAWGTGGFIVALIGGLLLVAKLAKYVHPAGAMLGPVAEFLSNQFQPKAKLEARKTEAVLGKSMAMVTEVIEALPADQPYVQELKKAISQRTPPEFNAWFDAWKKERLNDESVVL